MNLPYKDRLCTKCSSADIGDEFHYVFSCPFFVLNPEKRKEKRKRKKKKLSPFYCKNANVNRFRSLFGSEKK